MGRISAFFGFVLGWISTVIDSFVHKKLYTGKIIFNCAWEDPALDLEALKLTKDDNIVVITSAGCNVLTYAIHEPNHIYSIDRNPCQNALLELKIAAIKEFDFDTFWKMFGEGRIPEFTKKYYPRLREYLSPASKAFWDKNSHYFDGKGFRKSFFYHGCSGFLAWVVMRIYCRLIPGLVRALQSMFTVESIEEQRRIFKEVVDRKLWSPLLERTLSSPLALSFMNGVPKPQQKLLEQEGGVAVFLRRVFEWLMTESFLRENYFYKVYVDGEYSRECCPEYLKEDNFYKLKNGGVERISVHTTTITEFLREHKKKDISRFILLDHMDWLSESPEILSEEWQEIVEHSTKQARFLWRSASEKASFVTDTKVKVDGKELTVGDMVTFNPDLSDRLHKIDRVHTYTSFHVADLQVK